MLEEERRRALENLIHESEESGLYDKPRPTDLAERLRSMAEKFDADVVYLRRTGIGGPTLAQAGEIYAEACREAAKELCRLSASESERRCPRHGWLMRGDLAAPAPPSECTCALGKEAD